jgi:hypothetical protein
MKAIKPFISLVVSTVISLPFLKKEMFQLFNICPNKDVKDSNLHIKDLIWKALPLPIKYLSDLLFDDLGNVDDTTSTHWTLPRFRFAFIHPFMSTLQTYPLCHTSQLHPNLNIYIKALNFFPSPRKICWRELRDGRLHRLLAVSLAAITSTFFGIKDIFLPHLGHLPSLF